MADTLTASPEFLRAKRSESAARDRDLAHQLGLSEAQLLAAHVGTGVTRINAHPDAIMAAAQTFGPVMALTRNDACVHERDGIYANYHPGDHASMVLTDTIDLRMFPSHWVHGFAVEKETEKGVTRSLQVFDPAGDAVHKIFLRPAADLEAWARALPDLRIADQNQMLQVDQRRPVEPAKIAKDKADILRKEWRRLTDTHQFLRLCSKLRMNRLGAYRIAGAPFVRKLAKHAIDDMLHAVQASEIEIMLFVGNRGCIQIHTGPVQTLRAMGPWQNVLDPDFNLHLRLDKVAEVWAVDKPTQRGAAISVEAFDAEGGLILQTFGLSKEGRDSRPEWKKIVDALPDRDAT